LVTLEDLVEEIVGEIRDEYDVEEEKPINKQEDGTWLIDASVALDEVNEALGIRLKPKGDVATLGGYLTEKVGRMPRKGRILDDREVVFTVLDASDRKVNKVKALKRETPLLEQPEEAPVPKPRKRKPKTAKPKESEGGEAGETGETPPAPKETT
jgi:CBS domain containing-hemolysin-like protein